MEKEMKPRLLLLLLFLLAMDCFAREPQQLPPRSTSTQKAVRARDLGIQFKGTRGPLNQITDDARDEDG
jgi:hypothetical protein